MSSCLRLCCASYYFEELHSLPPLQQPFSCCSDWTLPSLPPPHPPCSVCCGCCDSQETSSLLVILLESVYMNLQPPSILSGSSASSTPSNTQPSSTTAKFDLDIILSEIARATRDDEMSTSTSNQFGPVKCF